MTSEQTVPMHWRGARSWTAGLVLLAACGTTHAALRPALAPMVAPARSAADATATGERLAFAAQRYRTPIFAGSTTTTAVYTTTPLDLITNRPVTLRLDIYRPSGDSASLRPLLVWIHGGAFLNGDRTNMANESAAWARLGYVTASIDYRLDPGNHCLQVQAGVYTGDTLISERARCERAILAARDDTATAIAWLRTHATTYGIDPTRVAVGGSSAGAITALHVGETLNAPGSPPPAASAVSAVLAMSGCNYFDGTIDAFDAPIAISASGGDPLVPFSCSAATIDAAAAAGTPILRSFYLLESTHAEALYFTHREEIDRGWRLFLIDHLDLA